MTSLDLAQQNPAIHRTMVSLSQEADRALEASGLDALLGELVKIRVSQINGCAHCLRMHVRDAIERGETPERLALVAAWWESQYFTAPERAALALAEEITRLPLPEPRAWDDGSLTEEQAAAVGWLAIVMNSWNRIAISSHYPVGPQD